MRTTIDSAGRVVIPKALRDAAGLRAGEVELFEDGAGVRIEPVGEGGLRRARGRLIIDGEIDLDDEKVRDLRDAGQR